MDNKGVYIFLGPPFSGKETQTTPLSKELGVPVFSMGSLIRKGKESDESIREAFNEFTLKGLHVPIDIKFDLLKKEMLGSPKGFILDNFPASLEDLQAFNQYVEANELLVNKVFYLNIGHGEMMKRFDESPPRDRQDDTPEALETRSRVQAQDRIPVLEYYNSIGKLVEINGEQPISVVSEEIHKNL